MDEMICGRLIRTVFWFFVCVSSIGCNWALETLAQYQLEQGLRVAPGNEIAYGGKDANPSDGVVYNPPTRLEEVILSIEPGDNIQQIAQVLAQGRPVEQMVQRIREFTDQGVTHISLRELLPQWPRERTNTRPPCQGPNCYNAALKFHTPNIEERQTLDHEFEAQLRVNYSRVLPGQQLRFGDLIAIVDRNDGETYHAAIYIDNNLIWQRSSMYPEDPWTFETLEGAIHSYDRNRFEIRFFRYTGNATNE